jgi:hypothetical protein
MQSTTLPWEREGGRDMPPEAEGGVSGNAYEIEVELYKLNVYGLLSFSAENHLILT